MDPVQSAGGRGRFVSCGVFFLLPLVGTLAANAEISLTCLDDGRSLLREPGTRVTMMQCQWGCHDVDGIGVD